MNENRPSDFEIWVRIAKLEEVQSLIQRRIEEKEWVQAHDRLSRMNLDQKIQALEKLTHPVGLLQKLSRWWNRSHYRALEQQLSELRTHQMKTDEAVSKLTETQENQVKTIANLVEGNAEINALVAGLKTEIDALKEAASNAEIPENIAALIAGLAANSKEAVDRSQEIADIVKPTEPTAQG